jgi:hypothetical protein
MSRLWRWANVVVLLAFVFSVLVQLNDPDSLIWIAIYGVAAAACGLELSGRGSVGLAGATAVFALAWAMQLADGVLGEVPFGAMFGDWEMQDPGIEEAREMYGLVIVAVWMVVLAVAAYRRARPDYPHATR